MPTVMAEVATEAQIAETEQTAELQETRLLAAITANPQGSLAEWAVTCGWFLAGDPGQPYKSLVVRVLGRLQKAKFITKQGRRFTLTKTGKEAANQPLK